MLTSSLKTPDRDALQVGALVICHADDSRAGGSPAINHRFARFLLESFPGLASGLSHCATVRSLANGRRFTVAAHWLEVIA